MNLLDSANRWLTLQYQDGSVRPASLYDITLPQVVDIHAPRADFRAALYQLIIGLLQTAAAPADNDDWLAGWDEPPAAANLAARWQPLRHAFEVVGDGTAFMQDQDALADGAVKSTAELLVYLGSDSNLHFNKLNDWQGLCESCFAHALFTLQINAPSGGVGHRTSLRGGGPLTTLLLPATADSTLWQKLWLNVIPVEQLDEAMQQALRWPQVLPWLAPTRLSDKSGLETPPESVHPLQAYWSTPRRIRLDTADTGSGLCEICGQAHDTLYTRYRTRNYGTNYTGAWQHPLSPYNHDPKHEKPPLPLKGGYASRGYRQWLALIFGENSQPKVAAVVASFRRKARLLRQGSPEARVWYCGFEMDNMKAKAWHDGNLPLFDIRAVEQKLFTDAVRKVLAAAEQGAGLLAEQVKLARNMDKKEPAVEQSFWQHSERHFYDAIQRLADLPDDKLAIPVSAELAAVYQQWLQAIRRLLLRLFDDWVLGTPIEQMDMGKVVKARKDLRDGCWKKAFKTLQDDVKSLAKG